MAEIYDSQQNNARAVLPAPPTPQVRRLLRRVQIIGGIAAVVSIGSALILYSYWSVRQPVTTPTVAATHFDSADMLLAQVLPQLTGKVAKTVTYNGRGGVDADGVATYTLIPYQTDGRKFKNYPTISSGEGYVTNTQAAADSNYTTLQKFFTTHKFTHISDKKLSSHADYESQNILCSITRVDAIATSLQGKVTSIGCANKADYRKGAELLQPLYDAYATAHKTDANIVFGATIAAGSGAGGYENAIVSLQDTTANTSDMWQFYYKKSKDTAWTAFSNSKETWLACAKYATATLKQAFKGVTCFRADGTKGVVQP